MSDAPSPGGPSPASRVALVVDDEPANRDFLVRLLQQAHLEVHGAGSAGEALRIAEQFEQIMLAVLDNRLPDMDGVELLGKLHARYPQARMVMATMLDDRALMSRAFENGCDVFLVKPHGFMELYRRLQSITANEPGGEDDPLKRLVIDQYGPRRYRGA